jgi:hypothetical protein
MNRILFFRHAVYLMSVFNIIFISSLSSCCSYHHAWRQALVWHSHILTHDNRDLLRTPNYHQRHQISNNPRTSFQNRLLSRL